MDILIDNNPVDCDIHDIYQFDELWKMITRDLFSQKRVIEYVKIDQEIFYTGYEQHIVRNFGQIDSIYISTQHEADLLLKLLYEMNSYTEKIIYHLDYISSKFYSEMTEDDFKRFIEFTDGLSWLYQAIETCKSIGERHQQVINIEKLNNIVIALNDSLQTIENLLRNQEFITIGDVIEFEIKPVLQELLNITKVSKVG